MTQISIFFGTESGTTRLIAKKIAKQIITRLGEGLVAKLKNINRCTAEELLGFDTLILGAPTYGGGVLPGVENGTKEAAWLEFLPLVAGADFSGVHIALYGLGDQESYPKHFCDAMMALYRFFGDRGAELVGGCSTDGFEFKRSKAVVDGCFVGLALDQHLQHLLTDERIATWLDEVLPLLTEADAQPAAVAVGA